MTGHHTCRVQIRPHGGQIFFFNAKQVDALTTLSTNPFKYLVAPRIIAGVLMLPILVLVGDIIGVLGGYLVAVYQLNFNAANYIQSSWEAMVSMDVVSGLVKATVFGFIITLMGCYHGFNSGRGAQGVACGDGRVGAPAW